MKRSFKKSPPSDYSDNNENQRYFRTSYNMSYSKPNYYSYSNRREKNPETRKYENKSNQSDNQDNLSQYSKADSIHSNRMICPDCFNRNIMSHKEKYLYSDRFVPRSFVDNLSKEDDKVIQNRIKQRENLTIEAGKYLNNIRDNDINKLQTEYQNGDFFDTSLEHGRLRAQKKNMINNNKIKNNMMAYSNFENPKISDYYRKYVNNDDNILIKERSPKMTKDEYNKMMIDQIEENRRLRRQREYDEKMEDERLLRNQIENDNIKMEEEYLKRKNDWDNYQDENYKLLQSKKLRNQAEDMERKYEEKKMMKENEREMEKDYENEQRKKQEILDMTRENYYNSKLKKQDEIRLKEMENKRNYPGLCTHGYQLEKCDICNKMYPKQVLTKVVYNKKTKSFDEY